MLLTRNVCTYLLILTLIGAFATFLLGTRFDVQNSRYLPGLRQNRQQGSTYTGGVFLLPTDAVIDVMDENQLTETYWKYINTLQVLCRNQTRLGSMRDGGKEICVDDLYKPKDPCLVYSFGSNFQFDFEVAVIQNFKCEVHTFDPSKPLKQGQQIPPGVNFHLVGLSNRTYTTPNKWKMETLSSIRASLNHSNRLIDILKIDIEGGEWIALPDIISSGNMKNVKQLSIEIHFGRRGKGYKLWGNVSLRHQLKVLRLLYEETFHIFMREHNIFRIKPFHAPFPQITALNEISLINTGWNK